MSLSFALGLIFSLLFYLHGEIHGSPSPCQNVVSSNTSSQQNSLALSSNSQITFRQNNKTVLLTRAQRAIQGSQTIQKYQQAHSLKRRQRDTDRIIGGTAAEPHEFPHQVYLSRPNKPCFCGGSIMSKWLILTAAHCLRNVNVSGLTVTAGVHDKSSTSGLEQIRAVEEMVVHPNHTRGSRKSHDIAILVLSVPLSLSAAVRSIRLPNRDATFSGNTTVSGWGLTAESNGTISDILKKITVPIVPNSLCNSQYANISITEQMFCAGEEGQDSCQGDSGGPALCSGGWGLDRSTVLCGIVSFGKGCGRAGLPGVYVQVSKYIGWILGVLNNRTRENDCLRGGQTPSNTADWTKCVTKYVLPAEAETTTPCGTRNEQPGFLLVTNHSSLLKIHLNQTDLVEPVPLLRSYVEYAVDFDVKNNLLYWVDSGKNIKRLHMNGNGQPEPEVLVLPEVEASITRLAFDWMSGNLYFTNCVNSKIGVIRTISGGGGSSGFDGQMRKTLLEKPDVSKPWGITVHPQRGYIFWTDGRHGNSFIGRAHLDGSHATQIVSNYNSSGGLLTTPIILDDPTGIALDYTDNRIYWVDYDLGRIMTADLNGDDVKIVLQADSRTKYAYVVGIYKNTIYWSDLSTKALYKAPLQLDKTVETNSVSKIVGGNGDLRDLKLYGGDSQQGENICTYSNCRYICMVSPPRRSQQTTTVSCLCPDGFTKQTNNNNDTSSCV